jgi:hypothetical protein
VNGAILWGVTYNTYTPFKAFPGWIKADRGIQAKARCEHLPVRSTVAPAADDRGPSLFLPAGLNPYEERSINQNEPLSL